LEAQSRFAQLSGVKLHYLEWEHAGSTPLVILPGVASSAHNWSHIAENLAGERRVIVLEMRGQGESQSTERYSFDLLCQDLTDFAGALGLGYFALLGASLGGRVAYRYAAHQQGRLERLLIVDIAPVRPYPDAELPPAEHEESFAGPQEALDSMRALGVRVDEVFFKDRFPHNYRRRDDGRYVFAFDPQLARQTTAEMRSSGAADRDLLGKIEVPTLIVHGARSAVPIDELREVAEAMPDATLVDIPEAGHAVQLDNPTALLAALRAFL
jgi:pimeloyl-ACP methyl ester carboxylesterase